MISHEKLDEYKKKDLSEINKEELKDIKSVVLNPADPLEKRIESFIDQIGNPYCFLCGDVVVRLCFDDGGKTLDEKLKAYLMRLRQK